MATCKENRQAQCKDCLSKEVCAKYIAMKHGIKVYEEYFGNGAVCLDFKNKADFVEVKHGRWETRSFIVFDSEKVGYRCSECKTTWDTETNYCPYCGADMRKEGASDEN